MYIPKLPLYMVPELRTTLYMVPELRTTYISPEKYSNDTIFL
jgi:hypothetical protein